MSHVQFFIFGNEFFTQVTLVYLLRSLKISQYKVSQKINYNEDAMITLLKLISKPFTNPNFHRVYLRNYTETEYGIFTKHILSSFSICSKFHCLIIHKRRITAKVPNSNNARNLKELHCVHRFIILEELTVKVPLTRCLIPCLGRGIPLIRS